MPFLNKEEPVNKNVILRIGAITIFSFLLFGCAAPTRLEMDYGTSYKLQKFNQTQNPDAEKNLQPVIGFDGGASKAAIERYRKGFEEESTAPVYSINIGSFTQ